MLTSFSLASVTKRVAPAGRTDSPSPIDRLHNALCGLTWIVPYQTANKSADAAITTSATMARRRCRADRTLMSPMLSRAGLHRDQSIASALARTLMRATPHTDRCESMRCGDRIVAGFGRVSASSPPPRRRGAALRAHRVPARARRLACGETTSDQRTLGARKIFARPSENARHAAASSRPRARSPAIAAAACPAYEAGALTEDTHLHRRSRASTPVHSPPIGAVAAFLRSSRSVRRPTTGSGPGRHSRRRR